MLCVICLFLFALFVVRGCLWFVVVCCVLVYVAIRCRFWCVAVVVCSVLCVACLLLLLDGYCCVVMPLLC